MVDGFQDRAWLARVSSPNGFVAGAAWALDTHHLVTCAHVVLDAGARGPGGHVRVDFPLLGAGCDATVLDEGWAPEHGMAGDVAVLRMSEPPPGIARLPVRSLRSLDTVDFSAYGFPEGYDTSQPTNGTLGKAVGVERVQLEVSSAVLVRPGFSGSALWSERFGTIVGMLTSRDRQTDGAVAFALPMRVIAEHSRLVADQLQTPLDVDRDRTTHWGPRSRGVISDRDEAGWLFSGRVEALNELVRWLGDDRSPRLRVVTGTPGSGKSAVVARLVTSADRHYRRRIPRLRLDDPNVPPEGVFDVTFHARGRTVQDFVDHVVGLREVPADSGDALLDALDEQGDRLTFAVDAVDEATESRNLCWLLNDLAARGNRVLVGCRPYLVDQLADAMPLRLDEQPYLDEADLEAYLIQLLSPRDPQKVSVTDQSLARELASSAAGNFLVAQLSAQAIAASGEVSRPFPRNVSQAFDRLLGALPIQQTIRELLVPLALAFGEGLPRGLWLSGAESLFRSYEPGDLDDVLAGPAASFLVTDVDAAGTRRHRLFHQALSEALTRDRDIRSDHVHLLESWISSLPRTTDGQSRWDDADPYLLTFAAEHAAAGGSLNSLIADHPGYLAAADPNRLLLALPAATSPDARKVRAVYRLAFDALPAASFSERVSYLEMAARKRGASDFAERLNRLSASIQPWTVRWARWRSAADHFIVGRHDGPVGTVALGQLDGRPVAVSGSDDGTVRVWDLRSGAPFGDPLVDGGDPVRALTLCEIDGATLAVTGSQDGMVRVWDLRARAQLGEPLSGGSGSVESVALGTLDGESIVLSGSVDGSTRVWDLGSRAQLGGPLTGHKSSVAAVAVGNFDGQSIAVTASRDGTLCVWDLASRTRLSGPHRGDAGSMEAMALGQLDGLLVAITGSGYGPLHVWDLPSGTGLGEQLAGHDGSVGAVALGELDGRPVALSGGHDQALRLWDLERRAQLRDPLTGHDSWILAVALGDLDGRPIALSGGHDRTVRVWDLTGGRPRGEQVTIGEAMVWAVALGEVNGRRLALSGSRSKVRVWDLASGAGLGELLTGDDRAVEAIAFSEVEGRPVAVAGSGPELRVWEVESRVSRRPLVGHSSWVRAVSVGIVSGRPIALSGSDDGTLRVWDLVSGAQLSEPLRGDGGWVRAVALCELDGKPVALGGCYDGMVRIWDLASGAQLGEPLIGHDSWVTALAAGDIDGRPIALSAGSDGMVRLWDLAAGGQQGEPVTAHEGSASAVTLGVLRGRSVAVSGGHDGVVRVRDLNMEHELTITVGSAVEALVFHPPSALLLGARAGTMLIDLARPRL